SRTHTPLSFAFRQPCRRHAPCAGALKLRRAQPQPTPSPPPPTRATRAHSIRVPRVQRLHPLTKNVATPPPHAARNMHSPQRSGVGRTTRPPGKPLVPI